MKKSIFNLTVIVCVFTIVTGCSIVTKSQTTTKGKPVLIIYDTDIDLDVDDVGALALLHALEDNGEAKILGIICNAPTPYGATTISAINMYYGRPEIPIGDMPIDEYVYDKSFSKRYQGYSISTPYGNFNLPIFKRFETNIKSRADVWNGVTLYRKLLVEAPDNSVTIASVGLLTVLEDLMLSSPDKYSKLTGKELIKKKVNKLVCMAGDKQPEPGKSDFNWGFEGRGDAERVSRQWPTKLIIMPHGGKIKTGARLTTETPESNPVRAAYQLFLAKQADKNRSSWDQLACLYAVRGAGELFTEAEPRRLDVTAVPLTYTWREMKKGEAPHILLKQKAPDDTFKKVVEDLMVQLPKNIKNNVLF